MEGVWGLIFVVVLIGAVALVIWARRMAHERDMAVSNAALAVLPPVPEDPAVVAARAELAEEVEWERQETERVAAWEEWERSRDTAIANLKLNPPDVLYKIERGLDNIYRVHRWILTRTERPRHAFNHADDAKVRSHDVAVAYGFDEYPSSGRRGAIIQSRGAFPENRYRRSRPKLPWPGDTPLYIESWEKMNELEFAFLPEAEQWLDDYLNPKGRSWGYGAMGEKRSDEGDPEPVESIESHFRDGSHDLEWLAD